ncbi:M42 family metallopeptidase [Acholeplasma granularum]|uniref:M42 family metallopeptidase n=1 Tax=Acholeplasma granularum TaxID=264635 RepID=UPI000470B7C8|nr:M42 family peptidase [Acholeplasma granularum]
MKKTINQLNELTKLNAISSNEEQVSVFLQQNQTAKITNDKLGSVILTKGSGKKVMITAHMDEFGMIISQITKNGLLRFQPVGTFNVSSMVHNKFVITSNKGQHTAVLTAKPFMQQSAEERLKTPDVKSLYLDAGFTSDEAVKDAGIEVGDMVTRYHTFEVINEDIIISKALDNRSGVCVLNELIDEVNDLKCELNVSFTVQNQMAMKGSKTTSFMIEPDIAISLDVFDSDDIYGESKYKLGHGPLIIFYDQGLIAHNGLRNYIIDIAKKHNIPYQEASNEKESSEGGYLQLSKLGAATVSIGIPIRNRNTQNEMVSLSDLINTKKLLKLFLESLNDLEINHILTY